MRLLGALLLMERMMKCTLMMLQRPFVCLREPVMHHVKLQVLCIQYIIFKPLPSFPSGDYISLKGPIFNVYLENPCVGWQTVLCSINSS